MEPILDPRECVLTERLIDDRSIMLIIVSDDKLNWTEIYFQQASKHSGLGLPAMQVLHVCSHRPHCFPNSGSLSWHVTAMGLESQRGFFKLVVAYVHVFTNSNNECINAINCTHSLQLLQPRYTAGNIVDSIFQNVGYLLIFLITCVGALSKIDYLYNNQLQQVYVMTLTSFWTRVCSSMSSVVFTQHDLMLYLSPKEVFINTWKSSDLEMSLWTAGMAQVMTVRWVTPRELWREVPTKT